MDQIARAGSAGPLGSAATTSPFGRLGYPAGSGSRDLRFDFMRGFAMLSVVAAHLEMFSWFNFLFWERLGFITAAEMFVVTAGLVLGLVNRKVIDREGIEEVTKRLLKRGWVLYRALVATVLLVIVIARLIPIDMTALTTFTDRWAGVSYPMIPPEEMPWYEQLWLVFLMRVSPHQIQILGLYVVLIAALAPLAIWLLHRRMLFVYFAATWALYALGWFRPVDAPFLGMQFEYAFPPLMYQVLFTHALAVGFFREEIAERLADASLRRLVVGGAVALALVFLLAAQTTPNPSFPSWSRLGSIPGDQWQAFYDALFMKKHPSPLRLLNVAVFFGAFYALLTYCWAPINKALGWLLMPLGEASLYVFLMHLVFIALIDQIPGYFDVIPAWDQVWGARLWINTGLYLATILGLWLMVRHRVLFGVVPR